MTSKSWPPEATCTLHATEDEEDTDEGAWEPHPQITPGTQPLRADTTPTTSICLVCWVQHTKPKHIGPRLLLQSREGPVTWTRAVVVRVPRFLSSYCCSVTNSDISIRNSKCTGPRSGAPTTQGDRAYGDAILAQ